MRCEGAAGRRADSVAGGSRKSIVKGPKGVTLHSDLATITVVKSEPAVKDPCCPPQFLGARPLSYKPGPHQHYISTVSTGEH